MAVAPETPRKKTEAAGNKTIGGSTNDQTYNQLPSTASPFAPNLVEANAAQALDLAPINEEKDDNLRFTGYGMERKEEYQPLEGTIKTETGAMIQKHQCALEHHPQFILKIDQGKKAMKKLMCTAIVCFCFMCVEIVGGYLSNSLAVATDAAHTLSDVAGFMINFASIYVSQSK